MTSNGLLSSYAIITSDKHGTILSANQNASKLFGKAIVDLIGQNVTILMPSPFKDQHETYMDRYHRTNEPRVLGRSREVVGVHSSGAYLKLNLSLSKAESARGTIYIAMFEKSKDTRVIFDINKKGLITQVKGNIRLLLGYHSSELIGKNISVICPEPFRSHHDQFIQNYHDSGNKKVLDRVRNLQALHKNMTTINISLFVTESKVKPLVSLSTHRSPTLAESSAGNVVINENENEEENEKTETANLEDGFRGVITPVDDIEAMITIDSKGVIINSSVEFLNLFGYKENELNGQSIQILVKGDITEITGKLFSVGTFRKSIRAVHKDSSIFSVHFEATKKYSSDEKRDKDAYFVCKIYRTGNKKMDKEIITEGSYLGHYAYGKTLGSGYFGKVHMAVHRLTGEKVAIKTLRKKQYDAVKMDFPPREISVLKALDHPYINKLYDLVILDDRIHLILEFVEGKDLCEIVEAAALPENLCRKIFIQVCLAIDYMHDHQIVHRDIKLENIIIDKMGTVKLIDMGFGNFIAHKNHLLRTFCGSPDYAAPELFMGKPYLGTPVDTWSLGVLLYVILSGTLPFRDSQRVISCQYSFPPIIPEGPKDLIQKLLIFDPADRLTVKQILNHPWICNGGTPPSPVYQNPAVDEDILLKIEEMGFSSFTVRNSLLAKEFNQFTTTYFLLQKRKLRKSGLSEESRELKHAVGIESSNSSLGTSSDGSLDSDENIVSKKKRKKDECFIL